MQSESCAPGEGKDQRRPAQHKRKAAGDPAQEYRTEIISDLGEIDAAAWDAWWRTTPTPRRS